VLGAWLGVNDADARENTEVCVGIKCEDAAATLQGVRRDYQVVRTAGRPGSANMGDQLGVIGSGGVGVIEHMPLAFAVGSDGTADGVPLWEIG
jgi:hypothetical protein